MGRDSQAATESKLVVMRNLCCSFITSYKTEVELVLDLKFSQSIFCKM